MAESLIGEFDEASQESLILVEVRFSVPMPVQNMNMLQIGPSVIMVHTNTPMVHGRLLDAEECIDKAHVTSKDVKTKITTMAAEHNRTLLALQKKPTPLPVATCVVYIYNSIFPDRRIQLKMFSRRQDYLQVLAVRMIDLTDAHIAVDLFIKACIETWPTSGFNNVTASATYTIGLLNLALPIRTPPGRWFSLYALEHWLEITYNNRATEWDAHGVHFSDISNAKGTDVKTVVGTRVREELNTHQKINNKTKSGMSVHLHAAGTINIKAGKDPREIHALRASLLDLFHMHYDDIFPKDSVSTSRHGPNSVALGCLKFALYINSAPFCAESAYTKSIIIDEVINIAAKALSIPCKHTIHSIKFHESTPHVRL